MKVWHGLGQLESTPRDLPITSLNCSEQQKSHYFDIYCIFFKGLSHTRNAKVISFSHDSLMIKVNEMLTSPPRISPFTNTSLLILHQHPIPLIPQQLFNSLILTSDSLPSPNSKHGRLDRSFIGAATISCRSQHIWTLRRDPVGRCYLGSSRAAAVALPCSGGLYRQKHTNKHETFLMLFMMYL